MVYIYMDDSTKDPYSVIWFTMETGRATLSPSGRVWRNNRVCFATNIYTLYTFETIYVEASPLLLLDLVS